MFIKIAGAIEQCAYLFNLSAMMICDDSLLNGGPDTINVTAISSLPLCCQLATRLTKNKMKDMITKPTIRAKPCPIHAYDHALDHSGHNKRNK